MNFSQKPNLFEMKQQNRKESMLTTGGLRQEIGIFDVLFFFILYYPRERSSLAGATSIVLSFDRKIIVHRRSGIYSTYIGNLRSLLESFKHIEMYCRIKNAGGKKKRVDKNHRSVTAPGVIRASQELIHLLSRYFVLHILGCPISFFRATLWVTLSGCVYINMQAYLLAALWHRFQSSQSSFKVRFIGDKVSFKIFSAPFNGEPKDAFAACYASLL